MSLPPFARAGISRRRRAAYHEEEGLDGGGEAFTAIAIPKMEPIEAFLSHTGQ
jgi:hypothetical protein